MRKNKFKQRFIVSIILVLMGLTSLFGIIYKFGRGVVMNNVETAAANAFIDITNKAIGDVLNRCDIDYNDLANIQLDNEGNIVAIKCDTVKLMNIKTQVDDEIQNWVKKEPTIKFSIALGSFTGSEFLAGKGPKIPFEFTYDCATSTEFFSEFYDSGINQTIHRILMRLKADVATVIPWDYKETLVDTTYIIAETVIVGKIPNNFSNFNINTQNKGS